jgi:serine/threonine protein kinase
VNSVGRACLADFGLANVIDRTVSVTGTSTIRGTIRWMAPELLSSGVDRIPTPRPNTSTDIYALAIVFWEVCVLTQQIV